MEDNQPLENKPTTPATPVAKKPGKMRLPSKPISFSGQQSHAKNGKQQGKTMENKNKKGGVNLLKKLSGM